ncbi:hypothetical protein AMEX_G24420 [Astyanax mexicanus]|uniref:CUB domain-containing protein n=1 Tax=Astyanax mexicanus TaxID=7994 RepID=A0A8T2L009_ASTMX|nr:hypothetical protein AMEX_G24420 [Astyanax mexicanus]
MQRRGSMCELCPLIATIIIHLVVWVQSQTVNEYDAHMNTGFRALEGSAFFALRSCHQILGGDSGEFFSPDYLCSSPALWCNWTIQVPHGKRVKLYLEDLTPDYTCHLKMDQIHLDESPVAAGGAQILERCWQSARYTSISNTVHVVQLIGPNPNPPHRGFYAQYQAFGPVEPPPAPTVGDPGTTTVKGDSQEEDVEDEDEEEEEEKVTVEMTPAPNEMEHIDNALIESVDVNGVTHPWTNELPAAGIWEKNPGEVRKTRGGAEDQAAGVVEEVLDYIPADEDTPELFVPVYTTATTAASPGTTPVLSAVGEEAPVDKHQPAQLSPESIQPPASAPAGAEHHTPPDLQDVEDLIFVEIPLVDGGGTFQAGAVDLEESVKESKIQPNSSGKPKPSHRTKGRTRPVQTGQHQAEPPHLPGGVLLEVSVEVGVHHAHRESWDRIRDSFRTEVQHMIETHLENHQLKSVSSKRSKRLSDGVLLILWVQFGSGQNEELQSTLQNLKGKSIKPHGANSHGTVSSISVEDINECETRLVMCDVNAECVNEFGSYSCHCLHGYSPGLGGAKCVDPKTEDCSRASFPELLYVVCVLLGFLIALLLLVLGVIYRRYHRGAFLPHCHSSSTRSFTAAASDANNNSNSDCGLNGGSDPCSSRPLPPPPPLRLPREPPNSLDLPLLKFTPLAPSGGFEAKLQSEKDKL